MQGLRDRLRWSEKSVLIIGSLLLVVLLLIVAGTDGIGGDSGGDPSVDTVAEDPAVQLDRQLDRIEELG